MANLTIDVRVNSNQVIQLGNIIDEVAQKGTALGQVLGNIGENIQTNGIDAILGKIGQLTTSSKNTETVMATLGQNIPGAGLDAIRGKIDMIGQQAVYAGGMVHEIGENISYTGIDAIIDRLGRVANASEDTATQINNMGKNVNTSGIDALGSKIDQLGQNIQSTIGGAFQTVLGGIGVASLWDITGLNAMDKEVNRVLVKNLGDSAAQAKSYWNTIDNATNNALISMRQAVPAINAIQRATGASGAEMEAATPGIIAFGSYVEALNIPGKTAATSMQMLARGIKGSYAALDDFGVTEEALMETGLWTGRQDDIQGFIAAVNKATGATEMQGQLLDTTTGKLKTMYKALSVAGAEIGVSILEVITPLAEGFTKLNKSMGGIPAKIVLVGAGIVSVGAVIGKVLPSLSSLVGFLSGAGAAGAGAGGAAGGIGILSRITSFASKSFSTMLIPMLKLAGVIAIMMPIVAGLAAEGMILVRLLGELFKQLRFDKLDIGKSVTGVYDLAKGFVGIAAAFGGLILINVANYVYTATGGILNTAVALGQFVLNARLLELALNDINSLNITAEHSAKVQAITAVITSIANAMNASALQNISNIVFTLSGGIENFKLSLNNLKTIGETIRDIKFPDGLESKVTSFNALSKVITSISTATTNVGKTLGYFHENMINFDKKGAFELNLEYLRQIANKIYTVVIPDNSGKTAAYNSAATVIDSIQKATAKVGETLGLFHEKMINFDKVSAFNLNIDYLKQIGDKIYNTSFADVAGRAATVQSITGVVTSISNVAKTFNDRIGDINSFNSNYPKISAMLQNLYVINQKINSLPFQIASSKAAAISSVNSVISAVISALKNVGNVKASAGSLGLAITAGFKQGLNNFRATGTSAVSAGINAIRGLAGSARSAGHSVGANAVAGFKAGLNTGSPGDIARIMEKEIGTYVPQLVHKKSHLVAQATRRVAEEAKKANQKGLEQHSPGAIAKMYSTEFGKYVPQLILKSIPAVKKAISEYANAGKSETAKGLTISNIIDINSFRTIANYTMNLVSQIQAITKNTTSSKTATQTYVQAWIDGAKKIISAEKKVIAEVNKTTTNLKNLIKTTKTKKKLVFDKKDLALLNLWNAGTTKARNNAIKTLTSNKKVATSLKKQSGAMKTAMKALSDSTYANDSAAIDKLLKLYDNYYKKLDKAEKKKAKTAITNIKNQLNEQKKGITSAISEMNVAIADIKKSATIEKNLRNILGTDAEINKFSIGVANAQRAYDTFVFGMRARKKGESDSSWLAYQQYWVKQADTLKNNLEEQQLYLDEAERKAQDYALSMEEAANATSDLAGSAQDLAGLAEAFNMINQNTVDFNLNLAGGIDILSQDARYAHLDKKELTSIIEEWFIKQIRG